MNIEKTAKKLYEFSKLEIPLTEKEIFDAESVDLKKWFREQAKEFYEDR